MSVSIEAEREQEVNLRGVIQKIVFEGENDWKIISFILNDTDDEKIIVVGNMYGVEENEEIVVHGKWVTHPKYGKQLEVRWWEREIPNTREGVIEYLSSSLVKGCGKKKATLIVDALGVDCIDKIIKEGTAVLMGVNGIGEKQAKSIYDSVVTSYEVQTVSKDLLPLGLTPNMISRIFQNYSGSAPQIVRENPYQLTKLSLIGFQVADNIAKKVGISPLNEYRIESCITYVLHENTKNFGHCYLPAEILIDKTIEALNKSLLEEKEQLERELEGYVSANRLKEIHERLKWIQENLADDPFVIQGMISLSEQSLIINEEGNIYPSYLYTIEVELAKLIASRMKHEVERVDEKMVWEAIKDYEAEEGITLAQKQKEAIVAFMNHPIVILTGGAGTGKTTVTKGMLYIFKKMYPNAIIGLTAPTGRASRKLSESTGISDSSTIHRKIGYREGDETEFNEDNPLEEDLVVVDEVSMLDAPLAFKLFRALKDGARVLFIGDPDQLPSVGVGSVLKDMLEAGVPHVKLIEIFRQAQESQIVMNSHRINKGEMIQIDPTKDDFYFLEKEDPSDIATYIKKSVIRFIQLGYKIQDIMVLSPIHKGIIGNKELNMMLQEVLNPKSFNKQEFQKFGKTFREGDKVIQLKNVKDKDIFNGDIGYVQSIRKSMDEEFEGEIVVTVDYLDGRIIHYSPEELEHLQLAYSISIHKSQGGEAPIVIMPISTAHYMMLARNLLYTAVTRAKEKLVLTGTRKALRMAIQNNRTTKRNTLLTRRISTYL